MLTVFLKKIIQVAGTVNEWLGKATSWLTLFLVLLVCFDVGRRYILQSASIWGMELEWHLFAAIFLLGAGYAFKHDRHVRVDLFYSNFSDRDKAWTNLIGGLVFLIPWCVLMIVFTGQYAATSFFDGETSPNPGGLKYWFIIKALVPIGFSLLLLQALANVAQSILELITNEKGLVNKYHKNES